LFAESLSVIPDRQHEPKVLYWSYRLSPCSLLGRNDGRVGMNRNLVVAHLAQVERHVCEGDQREIVAELERHGRGHTRPAKCAASPTRRGELKPAAFFQIGLRAHAHTQRHFYA